MLIKLECTEFKTKKDYPDVYPSWAISWLTMISSVIN